MPQLTISLLIVICCVKLELIFNIFGDYVSVKLVTLFNIFGFRNSDLLRADTYFFPCRSCVLERPDVNCPLSVKVKIRYPNHRTKGNKKHYLYTAIQWILSIYIVG